MYLVDIPLIIPQAWSLGLEMSFYLVIPWVLIYFSKRQIYALAFASFLIFLAAYLGKVNSDYFGYRLLLGTLFMFLIGWAASKNDSDSRKFRTCVFVLACGLLIIAFLNKSLYALPYNKEVLVGLMVGVLAISTINRFIFAKSDEIFGNLSYGVFLNHYIIIWIMQKILGIKTFDLLNVVTLLVFSCALAWCSFQYIERPADSSTKCNFE
jgi:peptidoglycan/LPS O-acetylase OafA/YrhL